MKRFLYIALLLFMALSQAACTPPECDPNSDQFDPDDCETLIGALIEYLTWIAYGNPPPPYEPEDTCPQALVCFRPECLLVEENGSFESEGDNFYPALWHGDDAEQTIIPVCHENNALEFMATTPDGPSASASAQVYQVIDYNALVPEAARATMRRVRAQAAFGIFLPGSNDDRQFGLRIDAYSGSPAAFPRTGDPETIPTETSDYRRLDTVDETLLYNINGAEWQPLETTMMLPDGTDFLVVLLEAVENVENDDVVEFSNHAADRIQIAIDGGNTAPVARPDQRRVPENTPTSISVTANDRDNTSRVDEASVTIVQPPGFGSVLVEGNGKVQYTPDAGFLGTDTFTYTVADVEGLISNEAMVTVEVYNVNEPPLAADDVYTLPTGGLLTVPDAIGVLANDTDGDGDALTAILVSDAADGTLSLDPGGAFVYQPGPGFSGTDTFTYHASDGRAVSNEATVTIAGTGYDLSITKTANPTSVPSSTEATFTVTVYNSGPETAQNVAVTDELDVFGITLQNVTVSQGTYDAGSGIWQVGTLPGGADATLTATALIHIDHTNTATITGGLGPDDNAGNNEASASITVAF